jgi:hypothetical protein
MPPRKSEVVKTKEEKELISREKQSLMFLCGVIMMAAYNAVETGNLTRLKEILAQFCIEDPQELLENKLEGLAQPFKGLNPWSIVRYPDQVWEESLIDPSTEKVSTDCPCMVSFYRGEINIRWTLPRPEFIWQCESAQKLAYTAMVIIEELFHIRQMVTPNTRALTTLGTILEFDMVNEIPQMSKEDSTLITRLLEGDVTFFLQSYLGKYIASHQWFTDRFASDDEHKPMTPQEFIEAIIHLTKKYGYAEEVAECILEDIAAFTEVNPELSVQMFTDPSLGKFISKEA